MRRKVALISFAFLTLISIGLALPSRVFADSPSVDNLVPRDLPKEVCLQISAGVEENCASGAAYAGILGITGLLSSSNLSYKDFSNYSAAMGRGDTVSARLILQNAGRNQGVGSFLFSANYAMLEQRPASGIIFAMDQLDKAITPQSVSAADPAPYFPGTGFSMLTPIQSFWGWSVTVSYSFMILIIIGVAFALMFRSQLDGTTVVQLQNAIPGIVAAMILIPLSYPISGLFIDAITLSTNVYHDFIFGPAGPGRDVYTESLDQQGNNYNAETTRGLYADDWRLNVFRYYEGIGITQLGSIAAVDICPEGNTDTVSEGVCSVTNSGVLGFVNGVLNFFFARGGGETEGAQVVLGTVLNLLFSLVAIVVSFRIAKRLLIKLLILMFMPIAAPFIFATIAIPGQGTKNLIQFLKGMAAASLYFIVTYIIFTTTLVLTNEAFFQSIPNVSTYEYRPPLLGDLGSFVTGAVNSGVSSGLGASSFLFTIVGAFLFLSTPKILDDINERLEVSPDFIPKALKPYIEDIQYSGDYALRKVPATVQAGGAALATGTYRNTLGALGRRIGANSDGPFEREYGKIAVERMQSELAELEQNADKAGNPATKAYWQGRAAVARTRMNSYSQFLGQGAALTPPKGEKGVRYSVKVEFREAPGGSTIRQNTVKQIVAKGGTVGTITIGVDEESTAPRGTIIFAAEDGHPEGTVIGKLDWDGDQKDKKTAYIILTHQHTYSKGVATITDTDKSFQGAKNQTVTAKLVFPAGLTSYSGVWSTGGIATRVRVKVGDDGSAPVTYYVVVQ